MAVWDVLWSTEHWSWYVGVIVRILKFRNHFGWKFLSSFSQYLQDLDHGLIYVHKWTLRCCVLHILQTSGAYSLLNFLTYCSFYLHSNFKTWKWIDLGLFMLYMWYLVDNTALYCVNQNEMRLSVLIFPLLIQSFEFSNVPTARLPS